MWLAPVGHQPRLKVVLVVLGCLVSCGLQAQENRGIEELRIRAEQAYLSGDLTGALPDFEKLVSLFPEEGCLHGRLAGCALTEPGRMTLARRHLRIANKMGCADVDLEFHRARLAQLEYDFERARDLYAAYLALAGKKARFKAEAERGALMSASVKWSPNEAVGLEVRDRISADPKAAFRFFRPETPGLRLVNVPVALRSKADLKTDPERMAFHDGDTVLVYSSLGKKGQFGWDLFRISLAGGSYGKEERLSDQVNTVFDERDAYLSPDGVLYFSSDRPGGLGGYDIYAVSWANGQPVGEVYRLPFPINSVNDDAFFIPEPDGGAWFASNRAAEQGRVHAYRVSLSEQPFVAGTVAWVEEEVESAKLTLRVYENGEIRTEKDLRNVEANRVLLSENVEGTSVRVVLEDGEGRIVSEAFGNVETAWELQKQGGGWAMVERVEQDWAMLADLQETEPAKNTSEGGATETPSNAPEGAQGSSVQAAVVQASEVSNWSAWVSSQMEVESAALALDDGVEDASAAPPSENTADAATTGDSNATSTEVTGVVDPARELETSGSEGEGGGQESDVAQSQSSDPLNAVDSETGTSLPEGRPITSSSAGVPDAKADVAFDAGKAPDQAQLSLMLEEDEEAVVALWEEKLNRILVLESGFLDEPDMRKAGELFDLMEEVEAWSPEASMVDIRYRDGADFTEIREMLEAWSYAVQSASKASLAKLAGDAVMAVRRQKLALRELREAGGADVMAAMYSWSDWRDAQRGIEGVDPALGEWTIEAGDAVIEQWEEGLAAGEEVWSRKLRSGWRGDWLTLQDMEVSRNKEIWNEVRSELVLEKADEELAAKRALDATAAAEALAVETAAAEALAVETAAAGAAAAEALAVEAAVAEAAAAEAAAAEAAAAEALAVEAAVAEAAAAEAAAAEAAAAEAAVAEAAAAEALAVETAAAEAAVAEAAAAEAAAAEAAAAEAAAAEAAAAEAAVAEAAAAEAAALEASSSAATSSETESNSSVTYAPIPSDPFGGDVTSTLIGFVFPSRRADGEAMTDENGGLALGEFAQLWQSALTASSKVEKAWSRFVAGPGQEGIPMINTPQEVNAMEKKTAEAYLQLRAVMLSTLDEAVERDVQTGMKAAEEWEAFSAVAGLDRKDGRVVQLGELVQNARASEIRRNRRKGEDIADSNAETASMGSRYFQQQEEERLAFEAATAWRTLANAWSNLQRELEAEAEALAMLEKERTNATGVEPGQASEADSREAANASNVSGQSRVTGDLVLTDWKDVPFGEEATDSESRAWGFLLDEAVIALENEQNVAKTWIPEDVRLVEAWLQWRALRRVNQAEDLTGSALSEWEKSLFFAEREVRDAWEKMDLNGFERRHATAEDSASAAQNVESETSLESALPEGLGLVEARDNTPGVAEAAMAVNDERALRYGVVLPEAQVIGRGGGRYNGLTIRPITRASIEQAILGKSPANGGGEEEASETFSVGSGAPVAKGVEYKVQVGAFRKSLPAALFASFDPMWAQSLPNGITRYMAGSFDAYDPAVVARDAIRALGYSDAFVVRFVDGERVRAARPPAEELAAERSDRPVEVAGLGQSASEEAAAMGAGRVNAAAARETSAMPSRAEEIPTWNDVQGRVYSVQVGAFRGVPDGASLSKLGTLTREDAGTDGWLRLFSGRFATEGEAARHRDGLRSDGRKDAFVVVYINGRRIPLLEASTTATGGLPDMGTESVPTEVSAGIPETSSNLSNVVAQWRVELGEYASTIPVRLANAILDAPLRWEIRSSREQGMTRYLTQPVASLEEATSWLEQARDMGFSQARLIELSRGKE